MQGEEGNLFFLPLHIDNGSDFILSELQEDCYYLANKSQSSQPHSLKKPWSRL